MTFLSQFSRSSGGTGGGNTGTRRSLTERDRSSNSIGTEPTTDRERDPRDHRESFSRWRERQYYGPKRWLETALRESGWDKDPGMQNND